ncbi:NUDIX hydrolase [Acetivibrio cellulolyticus]|uniref:NUDIX hydrolase n=1 Tax=Acetivibrio cellulolyticus TaxID=35830 RepID=UPI0001E301A7|nr:NUDIX domain-containing protein [Acetivibrio cellulolyticus]
MDKKYIKNRQGLTEKEFLGQYDAGIYERPSVTVDMLIFTVMDEEKENYRKLPEKSLKLLLVKRGDHPFIADWALPGGFVSVNESIDEAAMRELKTETNIDNIYMEQLYTWGDVKRDPRTRVISCSYMALIDSTTLDVKAGDDADDAAWFNVSYDVIEEKKNVQEKGFILEKLVKITLFNSSDTIEAIVKVVETCEGSTTRVKREVTKSEGLAFDHAKMIEYAIERLRNKINYTDIAFNLMPELFTLSELQQVFEIVLGKELLAAAFRRKVEDMVIETNQFTKDAGHRPSKLYRFNPNWRNA